MSGINPNRISLAKMKPGQKGEILEIKGGFGLVQKLQSLGIREGKTITKISSQLMRGPVILQCGNTQTAVGFGMASKIIVQLSNKE